jgi:hypothetical protein
MDPARFPKLISTMRSSIAAGVQACCLALTLTLVSASAGEPPPPLVGSPRADVLARLGDPRSVMVAAGREILFYDRERIVLRDGVVVEVELLSADAPRRSGGPVPPTPVPPRVAAPEPQTAATGQAPSPAAAPSAAQPAPAASSAAAPPAEPRVAAEPQVTIKSVRPPSASYVRPLAKPEEVLPRATEPGAGAAASAPLTGSAASTPALADAPEQTMASATQPQSATPATADQGSASPALPPGSEPSAPAQPPPPERPVAESVPLAAELVTPTETNSAAAGSPSTIATGALAAESNPTAPSPDAVTPGSASSPPVEQTPAGMPGLKYVIVLLVIAGVGAFFFWRRRQQQLLLVETAVGETPISGNTPLGGVSGSRFTQELLSHLDWKSFEELVASYYTKTGVVAERTKAGPASAVHVKISWKGESRPFALVHCIAQPSGPVGPTSLHGLQAVLTQENIRRGYVACTGKFTAAARDYAEEKHLTLMPGEVLLEKLNALPDGARAEVLQEITAGDWTTPSCPKCEAKMTRSAENPELWRCPAHRDVTLIRRG